MVIRVFPVVRITAPRLPLEKSYTFFIIPSAESSSTVIARGSFSTPSPSERDTPCFLTFAASFFASNSADTCQVYARYAYQSMNAADRRLGGFALDSSARWV